MKNIPTVDLSDFLSENTERKKNFIAALGSAFETIGFVVLKGHFLTHTHTEKLYREIKRFFALPDSTKKTYEIEGLAGQRGYTAFGKESAKGRSVGDLKEFWHFGQYRTPPQGEAYPDNVVVDELPEFNAIGKEVYQLLEKTGQVVLQAIALHLGLDENYFDPYVIYGNSILRPIHYPPIHEAPKNAVRAAAHGDINLITLLMGAQGKGLQVLTKEKEWIDAVAKEGELIINLGDMMARLTNNTLKSTLHQVVNPPKELWGTSRYSIPFFMHPSSEMPLNCLDSCVSEAQPKAYADCTAGEYLEERLIELGLKK
ncbi:MAG: isopenicillin N synthase family dioxygenase [Flavobacteriaceae bacterium]